MKRAKISEAVCPATDHTLFSSSPKAGARLVPEASRAVTRLSRRLFVDVSSTSEMNATNAFSCFRLSTRPSESFLPVLLRNLMALLCHHL
jgi:hypothetical protein